MSRYTILCINDDENTLSALERVFLEEDNIEIITANGGERGLDILKERLVDLIITDLYMPRIDGWKLCRLLRSSEFPDYNKIPILVMSATYSGTEVEEITKELGADGFVSIPYNQEDLLSTVKDLLLGKSKQKSLKILVVEDNEPLRRIICEWFKEHWYLTFEASNAKQARSIFEDVHPEIVILDYHLPDHGGEELLSTFKSPENQAAVLVITGDATPELAVKVTRIGADAYVRKPFKPQYLINLCEKIRREWSLLRVEKLLENRTLEFQRVLETTADGIMVTDSQGCITMVNKSVERMLGYLRAGLIGKNVTELTPEGGKHKEKAKIIYDTLLKKGFVSGLERTWLKKDGGLIDIEMSAVFVKDEKDIITGGVISFRDITERKRFQEELKETKEHLDNIIDSSLDCIIVADGLGNIGRVNDSFLKLVGYQNDEIEGMHVMDLSIIEEGEYESTTGEIVKIGEEFFNDAKKMTYDKLFKEGKITNWETYYLRKDRKIVPVEMNVVYLYNKEGDIIGSVGINRDITERRKAEREAREARNFLENIFKTTADGIIVTDSEGSITMVNKAIERMFGYSKEDIVGKSGVIFRPEGEEFDITTKNFLTKLFEEGTVFGYEFTYLKRDGELINVEINSALLKDSEGNVTGSVASIRNITERKKIEKEIKEARDFLENVFKTTVDGIIVADSEGFITMVNEAVKKMLGYSKDELIGKSTSELNPVGKEHEEIAEEYLTKLFGEDVVSAFEFTWLKKDGNLINVEVNGVLLKDNKGNVTGSVACIRDITERKKAEEALKKSQRRYHNLIEFANIGIIAAENDKITHVNRRAGEIYGYSKEELIGRSPGILTPEIYKSRHGEILNEFLSTGKVSKLVFEEEGIRKDGSVFPIEISFTLIQPGENVVIAIVRDITERKEMEHKFLQSEKLKSLGELSGGVAHDFNNVLAAILGRVQLLSMHLEPPPGKQEKRKSILDLKKGLEVIEKAAFDGAETVRRIQEFSRRRSDDKDFIQVDVNELIDSALEFTRMRWKNEAESKGLKIIVRKELSPLPPTVGSEAELREVFTNLINNALDAMPKGGTIKIRTFKEDNTTYITVRDTGIGISKSTQDRIFDPFFTTKGVQSTGLGLSVSYGIINRHRGTITVDSVEGKGTTFTIKLPVLTNAIKKDKVEFMPEGRRKARILVIEDDERVRSVLKDILTDAGNEVEVAFDGIQGIDIFERNEFDLVFTDLGMPRMSGWQVVEKIKSINRTVPVALITGWNVEQKESEMKNNGVDFIIKKPFAVNKVLQLVQEGMELRDRFKK